MSLSAIRIRSRNGAVRVRSVLASICCGESKPEMTKAPVDLKVLHANPGPSMKSTTLYGRYDND